MDIKQLVADGETEKAIDALINYFSQEGKSDSEKEAINLSSQYSGIQKNLRNLTMTNSQASSSLMRINMAVISLAEEIESNGVPESQEAITGVNPLQEVTVTKESVDAMEQQQIIERLEHLMKRRKFFQDQFDISSDAGQKFNLQENIDQMNSEIESLKSKIK